MTGSFVETLKMIKVEHSIFALPFALLTAFLAADGLPEVRILGLIILAMILARSAAMAFNRYIDAHIDARNPRTAVRSIPAGRLTRNYALGFTIATTLCFVVLSRALNPLAFYLSPLVMLILLGYSLTKRFTSYCHFVLGVALGLSPLGAWIAVTGTFSWLPGWLGLAVMCWVAGFDIIYACQDIEFDKKHGLFSVPASIGISWSLRLSRILHLAMITIIGIIGISLHMNWIYWCGLALVVACLVYEHALVWGGRLEKVDMAFFTMNGVVSVIFGITTIGSILVG